MNTGKFRKHSGQRENQSADCLQALKYMLQDFELEFYQQPRPDKHPTVTNVKLLRFERVVILTAVFLFCYIGVSQVRNWDRQGIKPLCPEQDFILNSAYFKWSL